MNGIEVVALEPSNWENAMPPIPAKLFYRNVRRLNSCWTQRKPAQQGGLVGHGRGFEFFDFKGREDEGIDRIGDLIDVLSQCGDCGFYDRRECPVLFVFCALSDPLTDQ
jgi:hypothetical protein